MHLLELDPAAKTVIEIPMDQCDRKPDCKYFKTESKRVEFPIVSVDEYYELRIDYLIWQHPDWQPPHFTS